jgi:endonuclease/exonuclease/phosphatase family metal-dependent hydrolase
VLAAGDLNEARAWDRLNPGDSWGTEMVEAIRRAGLVDVTWRLWGEERRTRFHPTHPPYQLDVVLTTPAVASLINTATVDPAWVDPTDVATRGLSDHAPVWFTLAVRGARNED